MTEAEWLACADSQLMLEFLRGNVSERKTRLFGVACCRQVLHLINDERSRVAIEVGERYADGLLSGDSLRITHQGAHDAYVASGKGTRHDNDDQAYVSRCVSGFAVAAALYVVEPIEEPDCILLAQGISKGAATAFYFASRPEVAIKVRQMIDGRCKVAALAEENDRMEKDAQAFANRAGLIRDVFNPFHAIMNPAWLTPKVTTLAQAIYADRAFGRMPELADALLEAGCTNEDILSHCRGPGPHVRGCWVVDLVLGKE